VRNTVLAAVALAVATAFVYSPAFRGELQLDDVVLVDDPGVLSLSPYASLSGWRTAIAGGRPLTMFTFALNHATSGFAVEQLHLVNLALHLCAAALVFVLARITLRRIGAEPAAPAALAVAVLFALHPLQTQAVAYIWQRAEVLAATLALATLVLLLASDTARTARKWVLRGAALGVFALALAAKQSSSPVAAAWLLHALFFPPQDERSSPALRRIARRIPAALPFGALAVGALVGGLLATRDTLHTGTRIPWLGSIKFVLTQMRVVPTYLRLLFWPTGLHVDWAVHPSTSLLDPASTLAGGLFLCALVTAAFVAERRTREAHSPFTWTIRLAAFGVLWFLVFLTPTSTIVPLVDLLEEYRVYLPSFGIFVPVGAGAVLALARMPSQTRIVGGVVAAALLTALGAATYMRSCIWATELALWSDSVSKSPEKARAREKLGDALADGGRVEEALEQYGEALRLASDHTVSPRRIALRRAAVLSDVGRLDEAASVLQGLIKRGDHGTDVLHNLAVVYVDQGRLDEAEVLARSLLEAAPRWARAHNVLGLIQRARGNGMAARDAFESAAALAPNDTVVLFDLADAEARLGRIDEACAANARAALASGGGRSLAEARQRATALRCPPP